MGVHFFRLLLNCTVELKNNIYKQKISYGQNYSIHYSYKGDNSESNLKKYEIFTLVSTLPESLSKFTIPSIPIDKTNLKKGDKLKIKTNLSLNQSIKDNLVKQLSKSRENREYQKFIVIEESSLDFIYSGKLVSINNSPVIIWSNQSFNKKEKLDYIKIEYPNQFIVQQLNYASLRFKMDDYRRYEYQLGKTYSIPSITLTQSASLILDKGDQIEIRLL